MKLTDDCDIDNLGPGACPQAETYCEQQYDFFPTVLTLGPPFIQFKTKRLDLVELKVSIDRA